MPTEKKITNLRVVWSKTLKLKFLFNRKLDVTPTGTLMKLAIK